MKQGNWERNVFYIVKEFILTKTWEFVFDLSKGNYGGRSSTIMQKASLW